MGRWEMYDVAKRELWGVLRMYDQHGRAQVTYPYFGGPVTMQDLPPFVMTRATITRSDGVERELVWDHLSAERVVMGDGLGWEIPGALHMGVLR